MELHVISNNKEINKYVLKEKGNKLLCDVDKCDKFAIEEACDSEHGNVLYLCREHANLLKMLIIKRKITFGRFFEWSNIE